MTKQEIKQAWEKFLNNKGVDVGKFRRIKR